MVKLLLQQAAVTVDFTIHQVVQLVLGFFVEEMFRELMA
jgi:hypothetical protein